MKTNVGKFSFAIPELTAEQLANGLTQHPDAGKKVEKTFDFEVCESEPEALKVIADKKWSIISLVNDNLKANARSNAYQTALLPYRPSEVSPEEIQERMVRDYIRLGVSETAARAQVATMLANL